MVGSVLDICNMALAHLRLREIASIDDQTPEGMQCKRFYQQSVDETLRSVDWNFARSHLSGVIVPNAQQIPGWRFAFQYPADCAAIRGIARWNRADAPQKYTLSQNAGVRLIYTNALSPVFIYTTKSAPVTAYDDDFVSALSYVLATKLAVPLTGKAELMTGMQQLARGKMALASADNYNEEPETLDDAVPDWLAVRGVPNLTREQRAASGWVGHGCQPAGLYALPGQLQANPLPPMITAPGEQIKAPYVPGLTAPVPPPEPILGSDEIYVHVDGGYLGADGEVTYDLPTDTVPADPIEGDF